MLTDVNDEAPFATPGHVFHTTTDLRAVDPSVASRENAWLDIRILRVGRFLYRLREDGRDGYDTVKIKSIIHFNEHSSLIFRISVVASMKTAFLMAVLLHFPSSGRVHAMGLVILLYFFSPLDSFP